MTLRRTLVWSSLLLTSTAATLPTETALGQVLVLPRRADKSQVRRFEFQWRYVDVWPDSPPAEGSLAPGQTPGSETTPAPEGAAPAAGALAPAAGATDADAPGAAADEGTPAEGEKPAEAGATPHRRRPGGLRLYYYEREKTVAEHAIPLILDAYKYLQRQFDFTPMERFPYILYNTYQEFLETRLFNVQEGILGVTSPIDLTLTLPYFGDHRRFVEVSTHEMAHQFTIQKLRDVAKRENIESPVEYMPLWFIEGLAEFYAQHGIDPETEMLARDIVVNPDAERGYALLGFFEDRPGSVLWTYKVGQARVAFLEDAFGAGTTQRILERSHVLVANRGGDPRVNFARLLERVTGESKDILAAHFADWLKQRAYRTYLDSTQSMASLVPLARDPDGPILGLTSSPDGNLLLFRRIDLTTGQTQLLLIDRRDRKHTRAVIGDGVPGAESLHPVSPRNFSLSNDLVVYAAQIDSRDVLYWQKIERTTRNIERKRRSGSAPWWVGQASKRSTLEPSSDEDPVEVNIKLGDRKEVDLDGLVSAESPSISPDGKRIAFIGIDDQGTRDVYVVSLDGPHAAPRRLTHDIWAERQLSWGKDGIVYTSDATETRRFNLFRVDPDGDARPVRLTSEDRDESDPVATADGRIFFVAYQDARADLHQVIDGKVVRLTDVATGLTDPSVGPDGSLWALWYRSGSRRAVRIAREDLMKLAPADNGDPGDPEPLAEYPLPRAREYSPTDLSNWRMGSIFGLIGAGGGSIFGQVFASATDLMHDHVMVLNLNMWGSLELTDGILLYINQERTVGWGAGAFQSLNYHLDHTLDNLPNGGTITTFERFFGVTGMARFPFSTFEYLETALSVGGTRYFLQPGQDQELQYYGTYDAWQQANDRTWAQVEGAVSLGHDTIRYHPLTGPLDGNSLLAEVSATYQPQRNVVFGEMRLDAASYLALGGSSKVFVRGAVGSSYGGKYAREFYLSSFDTLRGVPFGTDVYLLGEKFFFTTAQLQFPLNSIIRVVFLPNLEGVAGFDFGGTANVWNGLWDKRVLDGVLGFNLVFGGLVFRFHFAKPIGTGAHATYADGTPIEGLPHGWVTNVSLGWLGF